MLPPALGGLRFRVPPVPGRRAPGSMEKINVVRFPQDGVIILHPPFRRQIAKLKIKARRNEIMVRTKSRQICRGKAGASEMRPYQGCATDLPRGSGGGVSAQCDQQRKSCASATSRGLGADCRTRARLRARRDFDRHGKWRA